MNRKIGALLLAVSVLAALAFLGNRGHFRLLNVSPPTKSKAIGLERNETGAEPKVVTLENHLPSRARKATAEEESFLANQRAAVRETASKARGLSEEALLAMSIELCELNDPTALDRIAAYCKEVGSQHPAIIPSVLNLLRDKMRRHPTPLRPHPYFAFETYFALSFDNSKFLEEGVPLLELTSDHKGFVEGVALEYGKHMASLDEEATRVAISEFNEVFAKTNVTREVESLVLAGITGGIAQTNPLHAVEFLETFDAGGVGFRNSALFAIGSLVDKDPELAFQKFKGYLSSENSENVPGNSFLQAFYYVLRVREPTRTKEILEGEGIDVERRRIALQ